MKGGDIISNLEKRTLQIRDVSTADDGMKVAGYVNKNGSVSEILSEDGEMFRETILPQAFTNALDDGGEICFYLEHDPNKILATTKNGSLKIEQDDVGLHMSATIVPTSDGINAYKLIKSGIITNMSFGFFVLHDQWDFEHEVDAPLRTVTDLMLIEVSAVKNPAYTSSSIKARSKNKKLMDKSKINFRAKGGVKGMELSKFSVEDLKAELAKRDAGKEPEKEQPKEESEKVEQLEQKEEPEKVNSEKVEDDKLSQRDWYNLVMTVCRSKGVEPVEKRDVVDREDSEPEKEQPKEQPKEESKEDSEKDNSDPEKSEKEDSEKEQPKEDSEKDEPKDEPKKEDPEPEKEQSKEDSEKSERSINDFKGLEGLLKPIK